MSSVCRPPHSFLSSWRVGGSSRAATSPTERLPETDAEGRTGDKTLREGAKASAAASGSTAALFKWHTAVG